MGNNRYEKKNRLLDLFVKFQFKQTNKGKDLGQTNSSYNKLPKRGSFHARMAGRHNACVETV